MLGGKKGQERSFLGCEVRVQSLSGGIGQCAIVFE